MKQFIETLLFQHGSGKRLLVEAAAAEIGAVLVVLSGPDVLSNPRNDDCNVKLRDSFKKARGNDPSIIFISDVEAFADSKCVTHELIRLLSSAENSSVTVLSSTSSNIDDMDYDLRQKLGESEMKFQNPDFSGRVEILNIHTEELHLDDDVDLEEVSSETEGFSPSDINTLCKRAFLKEAEERLRKDGEGCLGLVTVTMKTLLQVARKMTPSALLSYRSIIPKCTLEDIGGMQELKKEVEMLILNPMKYGELFAKFGVRKPRGILLYGPPGCGKTMLARAIANTTKSRFISIKGPELSDPYYGQTEANIRQLFQTASDVSPCIVFLDEMDCFGTRSGSVDQFQHIGGATDSVITQLLTAMDGFENNEKVLVIGATNRPQSIDTAILRPGRFDRLIYVRLPDKMSRESILRNALRKAAVDPKIDLNEIVEGTKGLLTPWSKKTILRFVYFTGFSGADLDQLCQRAGLIAANQSSTAVALAAKGDEQIVNYLIQ